MKGFVGFFIYKLQYDLINCIKNARSLHSYHIAPSYSQNLINVTKTDQVSQSKFA